MTEMSKSQCRNDGVPCSGGVIESLIRPGCTATERESLSPSAPIWQDVLAQAVTGELLAAMNYTSLSEICDDPAEIADALEHAEGERGHATAFAAEGRKIGMPALTFGVLQSIGYFCGIVTNL